LPDGLRARILDCYNGADATVRAARGQAAAMSRVPRRARQLPCRYGRSMGTAAWSSRASRSRRV